MANKVFLYGATPGAAVVFEVRDLDGNVVVPLNGVEDPPSSGRFYATIGVLTAGDYDVLALADGTYVGKTVIYWDGSTIVTVSSAVNSAIQLAQVILKYQRNRTKIDPNAFTLTVYDDDGTTPLRVFDLKDFNGLPSLTEVAERAP